jgi:hypothetical protein
LINPDEQPAEEDQAEADKQDREWGCLDDCRKQDDAPDSELQQAGGKEACGTPPVFFEG